MEQENLNELSEEIRQIERNFKEMIEPYRSDLWKYCFKLTGSPWDAEDLVQETLLKSLAILPKLYQTVKMKTYLFKIATNLWIDQTRKRKDLQVRVDEERLQDDSSDFDLQLLENLEILLTKLTPVQYISIILSDAFQYKAKEVAEIIGTSEGAIHTNLNRARNVMRTQPIKKPKELKDLEPDEALKVVLEGFRKKDPEMIASVLDEHLVTDITHAGVEFGREETKKNSLNDWKEIVDHQHVILVQFKELWGRPVLIELEEKEDDELYLSNIHYFEMVNEKVTYWKFYCFSWDLMNLAAKELDVKLNAEYFYHVF